MFEGLRERCEPALRERLQPVVDRLAARRITPNQVTVAALGVSLLAALCIAGGGLRLGALVLLLASLGDLLDGMLARQTGRATPFGAFFDSTLDRIGEGAILAALAYQFAVTGRPTVVAVTVLALLGSLLVSYTRARAEALGVECKVGLMSRAERVALLVLGLLLGLPGLAVLVLAVLSLYTVGERVSHVRRALAGGE
jgi:CDP-diacylglycerol--glycerol-3-phosphate 3-phosphatidyltransferase